MGIILKADFKNKIAAKLRRFDPRDTRAAYQADIFRELYLSFPQFKAHVQIFVERNYCCAVNDEDHPTPESLLKLLKPDEVPRLNQWILNRKNGSIRLE